MTRPLLGALAIIAFTIFAVWDVTTW